jgi:uncharacterized protein YjaG (DUF416 family)
MRCFERAKILEQLAPLSERQRAAYAIACAERLLPLYRWFQEAQSWGNRRVLERGIELAWSWVGGGQHQATELAAAIRACEAVTPDSEDFGSPLVSRALDAATAVAQALEACISSLPQAAADAGEIAWECAFGLEQSRLVEAGTVHVADRQVLTKAAQGGLVLLEEDVQQRSLQWLRQSSLTAKEIDAFRREFAKRSG